MDKMDQIIDTNDSQMIIFGYRKSRWRTILVHLLSVVTIGIPYLVFHWVPQWLLYATSSRCGFSDADQVLIIETYQKKYRSFYIHPIYLKKLGEDSGELNSGFVADSGIKQAKYGKEESYTPIHLDDGTISHLQEFRFFRHKKQTLIWIVSQGSWVQLGGVDRGTSCSDLYSRAQAPPSDSNRAKMLNIYGLNEIKVQVRSIGALILLEAFNPFYIFQLFSIAVWLFDEYYYYCGAILLMSTFGISTAVIQTRRNQVKLRETVEASDTLQLWDGRVVDSREVAPGDVIVLPSTGCTMLVDAALLSGGAIVNESMLTGESVPVTKTPLLRIDKPVDLKDDASSILFCGTRVIQTRSNEPVRAIVLRTGYSTRRGELVRSILYPIPADFKFDRDSYKFLIVLGGVAAAGIAYTIALKTSRMQEAGNIALKALDVITVAVPASLPAAMTVGRLYAVRRLQRARISCLNTRAVNVSGSLDCVCFDKTGTLTEDGLDMLGVITMPTAEGPQLSSVIEQASSLEEHHPLKIGMATCHSLTLLDDELAGDPLDLKMFESTGWSLQEPGVSEKHNFDIHTSTIVRSKMHDDKAVEVCIVQQHQFVSTLQRASVVTLRAGERALRVYCKGAPEMISSLCKPHTVPTNLNQVLNSYAERGYRVIAMSSRVLETSSEQLQRTTREKVECELEFIGLVIMENRLKPATTGVIQELKEANVHVVMITGDNILTAVSVAKECGILASGERVVHMYLDAAEKSQRIYCDSTLNGDMISVRVPLIESKGFNDGHESWQNDLERGAKGANYKVVMSGNTWQVLRERHPALVGRVIERGAVFARMTSDQKQQLIVEYQALGYYVAMCGDGANDCGALRAAHTGISLSELESSVAAPFTSADPDISCVVRVLREGRAALTTGFGIFKFVVGSSLTQLFSMVFLYYFDSKQTDFQFLYLDVLLALNFAFFFGMTEAYKGKLSKLAPLTSLLSLVPLMSLIGNMVLIGIAQYLSYFALTLFPWYVRHNPTSETDYECWENYAIYVISMFQYIILAIVFSHGSPYRKSVITNVYMIISILIMTALNIYIAVAPAPWLETFLEIRMPEDSVLSYIILGIAAINFVLALFFERVIVQYLMESKEFPRFLRHRKIKKTPHLTLKQILSDSDYLGYKSSARLDKETNGLTYDLNNDKFS